MEPEKRDSFLQSDLEKQVQEQAVELAELKNEFNRLIYAISHDLKAPLRGIEGWSEALVEDYEQALDDQGKTYIATIRSEAARMGQLIDSLLNLSRVSRSELKKETIDLGHLSDEIIAELRNREPGRIVDFQRKSEIIAQGDPVLIRTALHHLLENAWKFSGKNPQACIQVGSEIKDSQRVFFIRDNGAGFNQQYAAKLFSPFQRLHSQKDFPGIGIGLAMVQRIIHRHGGRVWIAGEGNVGVTVFFTLAGTKTEE